MKVSVVQKRAETKDNIDVDGIVHQGGINLPTALSAGLFIHGAKFNPIISLKVLSYFDDGNLTTLPRQIKDRLLIEVKAVDPNALPELNGSRQSFSSK